MAKKSKAKSIRELPLTRVKMSELNPAPYNPRIISDKAKGGLKLSLDEFGYLDPIVWNKRTGNIVGGHQRYSVFVAEGVEEIDVVAIDVDEVAEKEINIALNNPNIQGVWDLPKLEIVLTELKELPRFEPLCFDTLMPKQMKFDLPITPSFEVEKKEKKETFKITIDCENEEQQQEIMEKLANEGIKCKASIK